MDSNNNDINENWRQLISSISHDLRAPVRHIREFTALLFESLSIELNDEQQLYIDFIEQSTTKCDAMINALSRMAKLYAATTHPVPIPISALINKLVHAAEEEYNIKAKLDCQLTAEKLTIDPPQCELLLGALIDNSFKFRRDTTLNITVKLEHDNNKQILHLLNNGESIPSSFITHCKTLFKQGDSKTSGAGVGLALVEEIILKHNGSWQIKNRKNHGTCVTLELPHIKNKIN